MPIRSVLCANHRKACAAAEVRAAEKLEPAAKPKRKAKAKAKRRGA